eukprot:6492255-Amphidinium_carterae.1
MPYASLLLHRSSSMPGFRMGLLRWHARTAACMDFWLMQQLGASGQWQTHRMHNWAHMKDKTG